jgi:hypothetical protein
VEPAVRPVRTAEARLEVVRTAGFDGFLPPRVDAGAVIWMKALGSRPAFQFFQRRTEVFQHVPIAVCELAVRRHERDHFRKVVDNHTKAFARLQVFLRPSSFLDVSTHPAPLDDVSLGVAQRAGTNEELTVLSIEAPQARLEFTRLARRQDRSPAFEQAWQIFGADRRLPSPTEGVLLAEASEFAPALIHEVDGSIGQCGPDESGKRVDDADEVDLQAASVTAEVRRTRDRLGAHRRNVLLVGRSGLTLRAISSCLSLLHRATYRCFTGFHKAVRTASAATQAIDAGQLS